MSQKQTLVLTVLALLASSACSATAMMIPVAGPLSERNPVPVLELRASGLGSSGELKFTMPDGDVCAGRWASLGGSNVTLSSGSLLSEYGALYLTGFSIEETAGRNPGQAIVACDTGRTVELEFVSRGSSGFGIGKDNEGNIYRFVF